MLIPLKVSTLTILLLTTSNFITSPLVGAHPLSDSIGSGSKEVLGTELLRNQVHSENFGREVPENLPPQAEEYHPGTDGIEPPTNSEAQPPSLEEAENPGLNMPNTQTQVEQDLVKLVTETYKAIWNEHGLPFDAMQMMCEELIKEEEGPTVTLLTEETREYWNKIYVEFRGIRPWVISKMVDWWRGFFKTLPDSGNNRIADWQFKRIRAGSNIPFWWDSDQMGKMREECRVDWTRMVKMGDLLAFNEKSSSFRIDSNQKDHIINELTSLMEIPSDWDHHLPSWRRWRVTPAYSLLKEGFKDENGESLYETRISQLFNVEVTRLDFKQLLDTHILGDIEDHQWIPRVTVLEWLNAGLHPLSMSLYAASMIFGRSRDGNLPTYLSKEWVRWNAAIITKGEVSAGFAAAREYYSNLLGSEDFTQRVSNVIRRITKLGKKKFWQGIKSWDMQSIDSGIVAVYRTKLMLFTRYLRRAKSKKIHIS